MPEFCYAFSSCEDAQASSGADAFLGDTSIFSSGMSPKTYSSGAVIDATAVAVTAAAYQNYYPMVPSRLEPTFRRSETAGGVLTPTALGLGPGALVPGQGSCLSGETQQMVRPPAGPLHGLMLHSPSPSTALMNTGSSAYFQA
ncbi:unnamed protein product [Protopolystoma xenopodis]|uniref:Uncharacterized protein n=1 Tax=Protopolystoma xenopodis TaxID=117903 RepID=A0A448WCM6_9PLAT|nr:unnamed protein product [Protopolystoma xenopodis]